MKRLFFPCHTLSYSRLRQAIQGRVVLITGASFGVGEACAYYLANAGAQVILVGRTAEKLHTIAQNIVDKGGQAWAYPTDLNQSVQIDALIASLQKQFPQIDYIISNAGKSIRRSLALSLQRPQDFERTIGVNYLGAIRLLLGIFPLMQAQGFGHVVHISSANVRLPPAPRWGAYHASKAAFDIWLRSVAPELRAMNISTSTIYLPLVNTRMAAPTQRSRFTPMLSVDDVAQLVGSAIVRKNATIAPWWLGITEWLSVLLRRPIAWAMGLFFKHSLDSQAVIDIAQKHIHHTHD